MNLDLPERWRAEIAQILVRHLPGAEVRAFGSRVTGKNHPGSDLDLAVLGGTSAGLAAARSAISESNVPISVDLLAYERLPESYREEIDRSAVPFPLHPE
jgi:predicted nucleotidyltransferase